MTLTETKPERSTRSHSTGSMLAVLWVFPEERLTTLDGGKVLLGRSEECHVYLTGDRASRRHASIELTKQRLILRDEGSRNGTRCNGQLITETELSENDVLRIGDWIGIVLRLPGDYNPRDPIFSEPVAGVLAGPRTRSLWQQIKTVARSELPVVVEGETGTGKEVVGQAVHQLSARPGEMVAVNCAALPDTLIEAQLFGHAKGAFTGAHQASAGYFGAAHRGTLFLDELLELPLPQQAKLLRAVEEGAVTPVGSTTPRRVDVRIVAATQRPLWRLVEENRFRADLQARLSGVTVRLPPLRQRREEVPRLFWRIIQGSPLAQCPMRASFIEALCLHNWAMNVRELVQAAHRAKVLLANVKELSGGQFRSLVGTSPDNSLPTSDGEGSTRISGEYGAVGFDSGHRDSSRPRYDTARAPLHDSARPPQVDPARPPQYDSSRQYDSARPPQYDSSRQYDSARPPQYDSARPAFDRGPSESAQARSEREILGTRRAAWLQRNRAQLDQLLAALRRNCGNVSQAARELGISRQRAHRLLEVHDQLRSS